MPQEISFNYDFKIEFASGGGDRSSLIGKIDNERELKNALMKLKDDMNYEDLTNKMRDRSDSDNAGKNSGVFGT